MNCVQKSNVFLIVIFLVVVESGQPLSEGVISSEQLTMQMSKSDSINFLNLIELLNSKIKYYYVFLIIQIAKCLFQFFLQLRKHLLNIFQLCGILVKANSPAEINVSSFKEIIK